MRILFFALLFIFKVINISAQTNHTLIIGIGNYPVNTEWAQTHGDNDAPLVIESLVKIGFQKPHIKILINSQATKEGIVSALKNLNSSAQMNDLFMLIVEKRREMRVSKYPQTPTLEGENSYLQKKIFYNE